MRSTFKISIGHSHKPLVVTGSQCVEISGTEAVVDISGDTATIVGAGVTGRRRTQRTVRGTVPVTTTAGDFLSKVGEPYTNVRVTRLSNRGR